MLQITPSQILVRILGPYATKFSGILFDLKTRRKIYRDLAHLLRSGLNFKEALEEISAVNPQFSYVFDTALERMKSGMDPSASLEGWVPDSERMIIRAAERSGKLEKMFGVLISQMDMSRKIQESYIGALAYPIAVFFTALAILVYVTRTLVANMMRDLDVSSTALTGSAATFYSIFNFVASPMGWPVILFLFFSVPALILLSISHDFPGRRFLDRFPPWSLYRLVVGAGFLYSLSALLDTNMSPRSALVEIYNQSRGWLRTRLEYIIEGYKLDGRYSTALTMEGPPFPDKEIVSRFKLRERRGDVGNAVQEFAQDWAEDGLDIIKRQTKSLNYMAMSLVSLMIALFTDGIYAIQTAATSHLNGF